MPVTPGVLDEDASWAYKHGQCLALAVALSRRTGWPIRVATYTEDEPDSWAPGGVVTHRLLRHAWVVTPGGDLLDIDGPGGPDVIEDFDADVAVVDAGLCDELLAEHEGYLEHQDLDVAESFVAPLLRWVDDEQAARDAVSRTAATGAATEAATW